MLSRPHAPLLFALGLLAAPLPALAQVPNVSTDIPPVQSLVSQVMAGVGDPALLLPPGGSPHGHQMRPSEAATLSDSAVVFWIGPEQSPWLADALTKLAPEAQSVPLMRIEGTRLRDYAEAEGHDAHAEADDHAGEGHDHGHDHDHDHEGEEHEAHGAHDGDHADADHDHDHEGDEHGHEDHADGHFEGDGHDHHHGGTDTHVWLDPRNALIWLPEIARQLAAADPANAAAYRTNAEAAMARIEAMDAEIAAKLAGATGGFLVYHDAYGYFTDRFGLPAAGAMTGGDAAAPGARRVAELQQMAEAQDIRCIFTEPQFDMGAAERLAQTLKLPVAVLDPVGSTLEPGPALYEALIRGMGAALADCLS